MTNTSAAKSSSKRSSGDEKSEKVKRVAAATLQIIWAGGIRSLNPTRVARAARVSRPWIYKYVGGSKDELMASAVDFFGRIYAQIDRQDPDMDGAAWMKQEMVDLQQNFRLVEECPWLLPLYYHFKGNPNSLGQGIDKIEAEYLRKKSQQIKRVVGTSDATSKLIAELVMTYRLATVHRWQTGNLKKLMSEDELSQRLMKLLEFVVTLKSHVR